MNKKTTIEYQDKLLDVRIKEHIKIKWNCNTRIKPEWYHAESICIIKGIAIPLEDKYTEEFINKRTYAQNAKFGDWDKLILPNELYNRVIKVESKNIYDYE